MVGTFRRREERNEEEKRNYTGGFLHVTWVFGFDICLFAVIHITPAWTRRDRLVEEEEEGEAGKER